MGHWEYNCYDDPHPNTPQSRREHGTPYWVKDWWGMTPEEEAEKERRDKRKREEAHRAYERAEQNKRYEQQKANEALKNLKDEQQHKARIREFESCVNDETRVYAASIDDTEETIKDYQLLNIYRDRVHDNKGQ